MSDKSSVIETLSASPLWTGVVKRVEALERRLAALETKFGLSVMPKTVDDKPCPHCGGRMLLHETAPHPHLERLGGQERIYRCANDTCRYEHRKLVML